MLAVIQVSQGASNPEQPQATAGTQLTVLNNPFPSF